MTDHKEKIRAPLVSALAVLDEHDAGGWVRIGNLEWSKTLCNGKRVNHAAAEKACAALGEGWRLPTVEELLALSDRTRVSPAIDTDAFPDTRSDWYWTSTVHAPDSSYAWLVYFNDGSANYYHRGLSLAFVRAVRPVSSSAFLNKENVMTDHKAEWVLVPRTLCEAQHLAYWNADNEHGSPVTSEQITEGDRVILQRTWDSMIAAAPAASEGEDGAVAWQYRRQPGAPWQSVDSQPARVLVGDGDEYRPLYTRPAAQVGATPKHDEGRIAVYSNMGDSEATFVADGERLNCPACGGSGHVDDALATQPAARRVTERLDAKLIAEMLEALIYDDGYGVKSRSCYTVEAIKAQIDALESFAQPAEGVE